MKNKIFITLIAVCLIFIFISCKAKNPTAPDEPANGQYTGNAYNFIVWAEPHIIMCDGHASSTVSARLRDQYGSGVPGRMVFFQLYYNGNNNIFYPEYNNMDINYHLDSQAATYGYLTNQTDITDLGGMARTVYFGPTDPYKSIFVHVYGDHSLVPTGASLYMVVKGTVSVDLDVRQITLINWYPIMLYWPY